MMSNIKEHKGIKYRVYGNRGVWFWETRKYFIWSRYPHACYNSEEKANRCAKNCIAWKMEG